MHVPPLTAAQGRRRGGPQHTAPPEHNRELETMKRQAAWYASATDYHPLTPPSNNPGQMAPLLQACAPWATAHREDLRRTSRGKSAITARSTPLRPRCTTSCPAHHRPH
ncbi:hypothetical protein GWK47_014455 [Chionoecetes opilio]|uniref:Uncharacterized protein n=1 Tax=Chionoecetes opilio TaxID=41210 RepID=A0A8J5C0H2_CHIOP|nr:hypothetical protein GWK47_014455 [Chionoecetes opilio]